MNDIRVINRKNLKAIGVSIALLVVLIIVQFYIWDIVSNTGISVKQRKDAAAELEAIKQTVATVEEQSKTAETVAQQLSQVLIASNQVTQAVERLEREADVKGVALTVNNIRTFASTNPRFEQLVVTLSVGGVPSQLFQFMDAIEHFPEIATITDFQLQASPKKVAASSPYTLQTNVVFYSLKENPPTQVVQPTPLSSPTISAPTNRRSLVADQVSFWGGVGASGAGVLLVLVGVVLIVRRKMII